MKQPDTFWSKIAAKRLSPFSVYSTDDWSTLADGKSVHLTQAELTRLKSLGDALSQTEVDHIYIALSNVLSAHYDATQTLYRDRASLLPAVRAKTPFVIAIAGSVAVGKSTTARLILELLRQWPSAPKVALVTTDGFLWPNAELTRNDMMHRKGFPESYDRATMLQFLSDLKSGKPKLTVPVYSHLKYDIDPDEKQLIDRPDILIFEGLNVLQSPRTAPNNPIPLASDFFDFSIYVDAAETHVKKWYIDRFLRLRETAFANPNSHFSHYASLDDKAAKARATELWDTINAVNLRENIRPTRARADLILRKGADHFVKKIALRRL